MWEAENLDATRLLSEKAELVRQFTLFSGVSPADCEKIVSSAREKHFCRRQTIFADGDPVRQYLLLLSGAVKQTQLGANGSEVILRVSYPGEIVDALGLCADGARSSTAQTVEPSVALVWDTISFEIAFERYRVFRRNLFRVIGARLREMDERFRELSTKEVAPRLGSQLVRLSNQALKRSKGLVEISLSRAELAQLTGTTLFTVSRLLCQWEVSGLVSTRRECVLVRDLAALVELSQGEDK